MTEAVLRLMITLCDMHICVTQNTSEYPEFRIVSEVEKTGFRFHISETKTMPIGAIGLLRRQEV